MIGLKGFAVGALIAMAGVMMNIPHSEDALMKDWSDPPPLPIFITVNFVAGLLRSMADALTPPPIRMSDIAFTYHTTILAHICEKFTIPDYLASGPKTIAEITQHMQMTDLERVERLMYALAAEGMTKLDKKSPDKNAPRFVNSALSATLRSDHPNSLRGMVGHNVQDLWNVWGNLPLMFGPDAVDNVWDIAWPEHPRAKGGIWSLYEADDDREEQFGRVMKSIESRGGWAMAKDGPFADGTRFIDVGGSLGHFLHKVLVRNPNKQGILFDREHVLVNARKLWNEPGGDYHDGVEERLTMVSGDFLAVDSIPDAQDGDVYFMRSVLHDWPKEEAVQILRNIRTKMGSKKATLLIGECAIPERSVVGSPNSIYHVDMQMMAIFGTAKERTPTMWKEILTEGGFELVAIHLTRSPNQWVEAAPLP
jgi:C-methyltransferase